MPAGRVVVTDKLLKNLKPPTKGEQYAVYDALVPGLAVRVREGGAFFTMAKRWPGGSPHPTPKTIGRVGVMTLKDARDKARHWLNLLEDGIDPKAQEERKRAEAIRLRRAEDERQRNTFGFVAEQFMERRLAGQRQADAVCAEIKRDLLPFWRDRSIGEITKGNIIERIEAIKDRGAPSQAHNALSNVRRIFNWAIERDVYGLQANPSTGLRPKTLIGVKVVRQRVLTDKEIAAVWNATARLDYPYTQMFRLLLITGQRRSEVGEASWREFDLKQKLWTIPEERFKSGSVHRVSLSDEAMNVLASCPRFTGGDYAFTAKNGATYANQVDRAKYQLDKLIEEDLGEALPHWRLHDLRRTVRTRLSSLRVPEPVAEMVIGHGKKGLERIYNQHSYATEMREALDAWAVRLRSIVSPPPANVVALRAEAG